MGRKHHADHLAVNGLRGRLAVTAASPGRADAQIIISPTVSGSPYAYSSYYPGYNYNYTWTNPYYNTYQSYWGSPYTGNYNWTWVTPNYYSGYNCALVARTARPPGLALVMPEPQDETRREHPAGFFVLSGFYK